MSRFRSWINQITLGHAYPKERDGFVKTPQGRKFLDFVKRHPFLLALYNAKEFYVEQLSVMEGELNFYRNLGGENGYPLYTLRRNTHRLEKGLSNPDRRSVFALEYIEETINAFEQVLQISAAHADLAEQSLSTVAWGTDVLNEYFRVAGSHAKIDKARQKYNELVQRYGLQPGARIPFEEKILEPLQVQYEQVLALARHRSSVRWYQDRPVPHELLDQAFEAARLSPSACNRQAFRFRVIDAPESIQSIIQIPGGAAGYSENVPCLIVLTGSHRAYFHERDRHIIYIDASMAAMTFMLALETLGLGSCVINWPNTPAKDRQIETLLNLDLDERVICFISVGYPLPEGKIPYSEKRSLDELRRYA